MSKTKNQLLILLQQKKNSLKQMQQKCDLQNKKIKLFRKQNQQLKQVIEQRSQTSTNLLLNSKDILLTNSKLQKTIQQLTYQLQIAKQNQKQPKTNSQKVHHKNVSLVNVRDIIVGESTLQFDMPAVGLQDAEFLQLQYFIQIKVLLVNDNLLTDTSVQLICRNFVNLQKLNLANNKFTFESMTNIKNLKKVKFLDIRNNNLGDQMLKYLSKLQKLQQLCCSKNNLTCSSLAHLQSLIQLKYLDITNNLISDQGSISFYKLTKLTHLYLMSNKLSKMAIIGLIRQCKNLLVLQVRFNVWDQHDKEQIRLQKRQGMDLLC